MWLLIAHALKYWMMWQWPSRFVCSFPLLQILFSFFSYVDRFIVCLGVLAASQTAGVWSTAVNVFPLGLLDVNHYCLHVYVAIYFYCIDQQTKIHFFVLVRDRKRHDYSLQLWIYMRYYTYASFIILSLLKCLLWKL
jgi:hypothetical protein